jgi:Regulator of chromosome condensation (RCC1) repeat
VQAIVLTREVKQAKGDICKRLNGETRKSGRFCLPIKMPQKEVSAERAERRAALEAKRNARRQQKETAAAAVIETGVTAPEIVSNSARTAPAASRHDDDLTLEALPDVVLSHIYTYLCAADLGQVCSRTSRRFYQSFNETVVCVPWLLAHLSSGSWSRSNDYRTIRLAESQDDVLQLLQQSYGGGNTGRVPVRRIPGQKVVPPLEFVSFAQFIQEGVSGHGTLTNTAAGRRKVRTLLPRHVEGRLVAVSPEHSLLRVSGVYGGFCSVASHGIGRRGQLGHGYRRDCAIPTLLPLPVRIVQIAAGGGLVRVAHSLFLTSTGAVLSCGTGQYGATGHGYNAAHQLPDVLRPTLVQALCHERCIAVSAGELHSAAVTEQGDVYTWGDGFCGQLGHADKRPQVLPKQVMALGEEIVVQVSCGSRHTVMVTEEGACYSCGLGHFGVLGRAYTPFEYDADAAVVAFPQRLPPPNHDDAAAMSEPATPQRIAARVASIAGVGEADAAALVDEAHEQARNDDHEDDDSVSLEERTRKEREAEELLAHLDMIANLTLDDSSNQCIPLVIESLQGVTIVAASAGHRHSLFLDMQGLVYSCGSGVSGCLGHGDSQSVNIERHWWALSVRLDADTFYFPISLLISNHIRCGCQTLKALVRTMKRGR